MYNNVMHVCMCSVGICQKANQLYTLVMMKTVHLTISDCFLLELMYFSMLLCRENVKKGYNLDVLNVCIHKMSCINEFNLWFSYYSVLESGETYIKSH